MTGFYLLPARLRSGWGPDVGFTPTTPAPESLVSAAPCFPFSRGALAKGERDLIGVGAAASPDARRGSRLVME